MSRQWKILLIDDSEISLHFAETALTRDGFDARATTSLDELYKMLSNWSPDLILVGFVPTFADLFNYFQRLIRYRLTWADALGRDLLAYLKGGERNGAE